MKFAKFLIQWHFDIERASLQGLNSRFEFNALRKSWFNQPFKFSAIFKNLSQDFHKILKKFSQDCCKFLIKFLNNLYKKFTKFSQKTQRILIKSLQKNLKIQRIFNKFFEFSAIFHKIFKHFSQILVKCSNTFHKNSQSSQTTLAK